MNKEEIEICIGKKSGKTYNKIQEMAKEIVRLQEENKKYIDIFNSTEKIMNGQERTKDKLLKENVELQKQLDKLKEVDRQICCEELITKDKYQDILKENAELQKELETFNRLKNGTTIMFGAKTQYWRKDKIEKYFISKDKIRTKIKELEEQLDDDMFRYETMAAINVLKELLGE